MRASGLGAKYDTAIDRDSAHERLRARAERAARDAAEADDRTEAEEREFARARRYDADDRAGETGPRRPSPSRTTGRSDSIGTAFAKSFARQLGTKSGQAIVRGVLGSIFGRR
jgi:hypothetical protein